MIYHKQTERARDLFSCIGPVASVWIPSNSMTSGAQRTFSTDFPPPWCPAGLPDAIFELRALGRRRVIALLLAPLLLTQLQGVFVGGLATGTRLTPSREGPVPGHSGPRLQLTLCEARGGAAAGSLVVIAGPPAAGKGTQCEKIKEMAWRCDVLSHFVRTSMALCISPLVSWPRSSSPSV